MLEYKTNALYCKVHVRNNIRNRSVKRKLSRSGNGWSLFMPKTIIELLNINPETDSIEMSVENDVLKIKKYSDKKVTNGKI